MPLVITRHDKNRRHGYRVEDENGKVLAEDLYGITTVLGVLDKPGLPVWAAREAGKAIGGQINNWLKHGHRIPPDEPIQYDFDALATIADEAIKDGYRYAESLRDKAATKGTDTHGLAEILAHQYADGLPLTDQDLQRIIEANQPVVPEAYDLLCRIRDWFLITQPRVISAERMVVCLVCGYGATLDLECEIDGEPWIIDLKTGSGVYESMALQTVAQAHALRMTEEPNNGHIDNETHHKLGVLWVSDKARNGCELVPFRHSYTEFSAFEAVLELWKWQKADQWNLRTKKAR